MFNSNGKKFELQSHKYHCITELHGYITEYLVIYNFVGKEFTYSCLYFVTDAFIG